MSKRLIDAAQECLEIAKGREKAPRIHWNGHVYVPESRAEAAEAENKRLREALTASAETKAAYIGEFHFDHEVYDPEEEGPVSIRIQVPWTTIKEIMKAIRARAELGE